MQLVALRQAEPNLSSFVAARVLQAVWAITATFLATADSLDDAFGQTGFLLWLHLLVRQAVWATGAICLATISSLDKFLFAKSVGSCLRKTSDVKNRQSKKTKAIAACWRCAILVFMLRFLLTVDALHDVFGQIELLRRHVWQAVCHPGATCLLTAGKLNEFLDNRLVRVLRKIKENT